MRFLRLLAFCLASIVSSHVSAYTSSVEANIASLAPRPWGSFYVVLDAYVPNSGCTYPNWVVVQGANGAPTASGKAMIASLMLAFSTGRKVVVYTAGCGDANGYPIVEAIDVR
jgi:hypothetical protein